MEPTIIAKCIWRDIRDHLYKARKNLRQITTQDIGILRTAEHKTYIAESLTQANKRLFNKCLEFKKQHHYKCDRMMRIRIYLFS
jgi:aspartate oxidase